MNDVHTKLGNMLFSHLVMLRNDKGSIDISDIGIILEQTSKTLNEANHSNNGLQEEIAKLSEFLSQTKKEIFDIGQNSEATPQDATLQVQAVIANTEEASHKIIDAASKISELANGIEDGLKSQISAEVTKIYEACTFQDLTSQRLKKVTKVLDWLSAWSEKMLKNLSSSRASNDDDRNLLNGPQLPDKAPSQDDIDALFSNLNGGN